MSRCHCSNLSGGWDWKAAALECIRTSRPNVAAWFNEIMSKSHRLAIWRSVGDRQCKAICAEDNGIFAEKYFPSGNRAWIDCWRRRKQWGCEGFFLLLFSPHHAMAACSAAADTKWSRERGDRKGVEAHGKRGKVGEMGTVKIAAQRGGEQQERWCIEK